MSRKLNLTNEEIDALFIGEFATTFPPLLDAKDLALLFRKRPKTIQLWITQGKFDGACRKRGKGYVFLRNRVIDIFFNGKEWKS